MNNELITFKDGTLELNVPVSWEQETVWITRNQMAELFDRDVKTIGKHINNALKEELDNSTVANFATVQMEGGREVERNIEHYNLDMILPTVVLVSERLNPFNPSTSVQFADSGDVFSAACTVGIVPFIPGNNDNAIIIESRIALLLLSHFFFMFLLHFS